MASKITGTPSFLYSPEKNSTHALFDRQPPSPAGPVMKMPLASFDNTAQLGSWHSSSRPQLRDMKECKISQAEHQFLLSPDAKEVLQQMNLTVAVDDPPIGLEDGPVDRSSEQISETSLDFRDETQWQSFGCELGVCEDLPIFEGTHRDVSSELNRSSHPASSSLDSSCKEVEILKNILKKPSMNGMEVTDDELCSIS